MSDADATRPQGFFEQCRDGAIFGWARDPASAEPAAVELFIDDVLITIVRADRFRADLLDAGIGQGAHAFEIPLPKRSFDSAPHALRLQIAGSGVELRNTPKIIVFGDRDVRDAPPVMLSHTDREETTPAISILMPTYNRRDTMERTIRALARCRRWEEAELIVVDDGSRDATADALTKLAAEFPSMTAIGVDNGGPARARNLAASMARAPILLFVGDDVEPTDDHFIDAHLEAHAAFPDRGAAILGKITWPARSETPVNFTMQHIQGDGQQQFGYKFMEPYKWYDWRLFYSSNISVKRNIIADWKREGFDQGFTLAAFEDSEFGYRLAQQQKTRGGSFQLLYVPAASLAHDHPYSVAAFIQRQVSCGLMARRFYEKHPTLGEEIGIVELNQKLGEPSNGDSLPIEHYFTVFEGLKSWALIIDQHYGLGSQNWHGDFLRAIFQLAFSEGYLRTVRHTGANIAAAARWTLERFAADLNQAMFREILGAIPPPRLV